MSAPKLPLFDTYDFVEERGINAPYCWSYCPPGWRKLLEETLEKCVAAGWNKRGLAQIKEKFGRLVVYIDGTTNEIDTILSHTEYLSGHLCQDCGKEAKHGNYGTFCEDHKV